MFLIIGLGNPGKKFIKTRHNIGFKVLNEFQKKNNFPAFRFSKKFNAKISKGEFNNQKVILAKPQTLMNSSGKTVKLLLQKFLVNPKINSLRTTENLFVVHDDFDLSLGKIRISKGKGSAGHKGVESIIRELKTKNFVRFRIGIKPSQNQQKLNFLLDKFVLEEFTKEEEKIIKEIIKKTSRAIKLSLKEGIEKAMNYFN